MNRPPHGIKLNMLDVPLEGQKCIEREKKVRSRSVFVAIHERGRDSTDDETYIVYSTIIET
jgi:hypothetical protein